MYQHLLLVGAKLVPCIPIGFSRIYLGVHFPNLMLLWVTLQVLLFVLGTKHGKKNGTPKIDSTARPKTE